MLTNKVSFRQDWGVVAHSLDFISTKWDVIAHSRGSIPTGIGCRSLTVFHSDRNGLSLTHRVPFRNEWAIITQSQGFIPTEAGYHSLLTGFQSNWDVCREKYPKVS